MFKTYKNVCNIQTIAKVIREEIYFMVLCEYDSAKLNCVS